MDAKLQALLDEAEIKKVHIRYCRGIDRMDFDLVRSCYHPDAVDRHGAYEGDVEGFIEWAAALLPEFDATMHFTGNQYVNVEGNVAFAEHYAQAFHRTKAKDGQPASDCRFRRSAAGARHLNRGASRVAEYLWIKRMRRMLIAGGA